MYVGTGLPAPMAAGWPPRVALHPAAAYATSAALYEQYVAAVHGAAAWCPVPLEQEVQRLRHANQARPSCCGGALVPPGSQVIAELAPVPPAWSPAWGSQDVNEVQEEVVVERRRRFEGHVFRLWVEDCMLRNGIRVHAMDTVSFAETHIDLNDASIQQMFDGYWEKLRRLRSSQGLPDSQWTDSEHNADLREFLGCLLDSAYFELNEHGDELTLQVPRVVEPKPLPAQAGPDFEPARPERCTAPCPRREPRAEPRAEPGAPLSASWIREHILGQRAEPPGPAQRSAPRSALRASSAQRTRAAPGGQATERPCPPARAGGQRGLRSSGTRPQSARTSQSSRPQSAQQCSRGPSGIWAPEAACRPPAQGGSSAAAASSAREPAPQHEDRPQGSEVGQLEASKPAGPAPQYMRQMRPPSARRERREERAASLGGVQQRPRPPAAPRSEQLPGWARGGGDAAGEPGAGRGRQQRPSSAKALKHKRVPEESAEGHIYEDREPSVCSDASPSALRADVGTVYELHTDVDTPHCAFWKAESVQQELRRKTPCSFGVQGCEEEEEEPEQPQQQAQQPPATSSWISSATSTATTALPQSPIAKRGPEISQEPRCSTPPRRFRSAVAETWCTATAKVDRGLIPQRRDRE